MHAFSGRFSRASLEGISFNFFVCFIFNVSIGSAPKRKNFDIQHNTREGLGRQFTSNRLSCHRICSLGLVNALEKKYFLRGGGKEKAMNDQGLKEIFITMCW